MDRGGGGWDSFQPGDTMGMDIADSVLKGDDLDINDIADMCKFEGALMILTCVCRIQGSGLVPPNSDGLNGAYPFNLNFTHLSWKDLPYNCISRRRLHTRDIIVD